MQSAFGVDHGEVSKAVLKHPVGLKGAIKAMKPKPARGMPGGRGPTAAQVRTQGTNPGAPTRPQQIKGFFNRIGEADISLKGIGNAAGKGTKSVGRALETHPGLTGTALVGGGGAAGYKYLNDKQPKKKS